MSTSIKNIFNEITYNTKLNLYILTILTISVCLSFIPNGQNLLKTMNFQTTAPGKWIVQNETIILAAYVFFLCVEFVLTIISLIAYKTNPNPPYMKPLLDFLANFGVYFLLISQLAHNLDLFDNGIVQLFFYLDSQGFIGILATISQALNAVLLVFYIINFFYDIDTN